MHLDVAVDQEVTAQAVPAPFRSVPAAVVVAVVRLLVAAVRIVAVVLVVVLVVLVVVVVVLAVVVAGAWVEDDRRHDGVHAERLGRADAARVDRVAGELEPLAVWVEVVPAFAEVEVEHVPADARAGVGRDDRGVADEGAAVDRHRVQRCGRRVADRVRHYPAVRPGDRSADADGDVVGDEPGRRGVDDADVRRHRAGRVDPHPAEHRVELAHVVERARGRERVGEGVPAVQGAAVEGRLAAGADQPVQEERHLEVRLRPVRVPHDDAAEQATVDRRLNVHQMVVERPAADRLHRDVEDVAPLLARADGVAAPPVGGRDAERPGAVGVDAVHQAVHVEGVRVGVVVAHVHPQPLVRLRVQDAAGDALVPAWLGQVPGDQRRHVRHRVAGIEVLPVDHRVDPPPLDLGLRDARVLMPVVAHAVPPVLPCSAFSGATGLYAGNFSIRR